MLIGRKEEQKQLMDAYESDNSEFVAVYGRRRVGKTFLIRETFNYRFTFAHTGLSRKNTKMQLKEFHLSLKNQGTGKCPIPQNWSEAFAQLAGFLGKSEDKRKVVFIDEMPWMDAPRSGFVMALEHFWNGWASARKDILLIICGSASSWIVNKVLKNHGGLHNRVSTRIHLKPFTLHECELYAQHKSLGLSRSQIAEAYMIMGGIPFYWSRLNKSRSLAQNIDALFFSPDGEFRYEFDDLYASLFSQPEMYLKIIDALGGRKAGLTREEIIKRGGLLENGRVTQMLENLEYCGFIRMYTQIGKAVKGAVYQLIDNYTLFYYQFIKDYHNNDDGYWMKVAGSQEHAIWSGLAFERLCLQHTAQIKSALGISGVLANVYSWHTGADKENAGAQIDLLIDRADGVIDVCEMKYSKAAYSITAEYRDNLQNKVQRFADVTRTKKALHIVMIAANGLKPNQYSDIVQSEVTLDDLFN